MRGGEESKEKYDMKKEEIRKLLNEFEIRLYRGGVQGEKGFELKEKSNHKKMLVTLVNGGGKGSAESGKLVVGAVFHVLGEDNTGEFDPYFVERIKNSL